MDMKKILALTVIGLALFGCMSAASAGMFDFLGGEKTQTYTFDGFTLDIPEDANVHYKNESDRTADINIYTIDNKGGDDFLVTSASGEVASSMSKYTSMMENAGAVDEGTHGDWTIFNIKKADLNVGRSMNAESDYMMVNLTHKKIITLQGDDLDALKKMSDTYKEI